MPLQKKELLKSIFLMRSYQSHPPPQLLQMFVSIKKRNPSLTRRSYKLETKNWCFDTNFATPKSTELCPCKQIFLILKQKHLEKHKLSKDHNKNNIKYLKKYMLIVSWNISSHYIYICFLGNVFIKNLSFIACRRHIYTYSISTIKQFSRWYSSFCGFGNPDILGKRKRYKDTSSSLL